DGLPDAWELYYFGNTSQNATGDPDGDRLNNLLEYQLGTNPTNGLSPGYLAAIQPLGNQVQLVVLGEPGRAYTVQSSTNLKDWVPVLSFTNTNGTITVMGPAGTNLLQQFYRTRLLP